MSVSQRRLDSSLSRVRGSQILMSHPVRFKNYSPRVVERLTCSEAGPLRGDVEFSMPMTSMGEIRVGIHRPSSDL
jgi:hypothetical protein